jgi:hypothetical protein
MNKSKKDLIKNIHADSCYASKLIIEKEFPKLFKKEEKANGWYKDTTINKWCMFFKNGIMKYGVSTLGYWLKDLNTTYILSDEDYKATNEEVKETLTKEAIKKGFEIGVKTEYGVINNNYKHEFRPKTNVFYFGNIEVFNNGKWAEIIKEPIVKDVLEAGKYYKLLHSTTGCLIISNFNGNLNTNQYGFTSRGEWSNDLGTDWFNSKSATTNLMTDKEVYQALSEGAIKKGFKEGVLVNQKPAYNGNGGNFKITDSNFEYDSSTNNLTIGGVGIYSSGKWAEILETITRKQAEKELGKVITD